MSTEYQLVVYPDTTDLKPDAVKDLDENATEFSNKVRSLMSNNPPGGGSAWQPLGGVSAVEVSVPITNTDSSFEVVVWAQAMVR